MPDKKNFQCSRCGECCKRLTILLSWNDINKIKLMGYEEGEFAEKESIGQYKGRWILKKKNDEACIFLNNDFGFYFCEIYDLRPIICRQYPFFGGKVESCKPLTLVNDDAR